MSTLIARAVGLLEGWDGWDSAGRKYPRYDQQ